MGRMEIENTAWQADSSAEVARKAAVDTAPIATLAIVTARFCRKSKKVVKKGTRNIIDMRRLPLERARLQGAEKIQNSEPRSSR